MTEPTERHPSSLNAYRASAELLRRRLVNIIATSHGGKRALFVAKNGDCVTSLPCNAVGKNRRLRRHFHLVGVYNTRKPTFSADRMMEDIEFTLEEINGQPIAA